MRLPWSLVLSFVVGLALLFLIGRLLLTPMRFLWRLAAGALLGALVIVVINFFSFMTGFTIALNPFTALAIGFLGLPGAGMLIAFRFLL